MSYRRAIADNKSAAELPARYHDCMSKRLAAWAIFLLFLILLSLGFTPYSHTANLLLISIRLAIIAVVSILFLRERWRYRHHPHSAEPDAGDAILRRWRRWFYDE
jgi:hypothetical protein